MKWAFVAGGTGGHIYPAIAVADYLKHQDSVQDSIFITTDKPLDQKIINEESGYDFFPMKGAGFNQAGVKQKLRSLVSFVAMFFKSIRIIKKHNIDCILGTGGYMSAPVLLAARFCGAVTASLEPNVVVGLSNKLVSKFVNKIFFAFKESESYLNKSNCVFTGNPIRNTILKIEAPKFDAQSLCIMIFGGSQGAKQINDLLIQALPSLKKYKDSIRFVHQTGKHSFDEVSKAYSEYELKHDVHEYIYDIAQAYEQADIIIGRAGSSVLEIAACGRPSILIPYPYAADNHQEENAKVMEKNKASFVLSGQTIAAQDFVACLENLILDQEKREAFKAGALSLRHEQAAKTIVEILKNECGRA